jgi:cytochrome c oxidase subunit II
VSTPAATADQGAAEPRHGVRIAVIWAIATVIAVPLMIWVIGPNIPPGSLSDDSRDQHNVNVVLATLAMPVLMLIWVYFAYAIRNFRQPAGDITDGPPLRSHARLQVVWLVVTSVMVLGLATYGTIDLLDTAGTGGGEGPSPLATPSHAKDAFQVQVIGQQWAWTFRYPSYGGVETTVLDLPVNREIEFHVTSLDVIHSFWAIELGVKADAVPNSDNTAFVKASKTGSFQVRCAELCGLFHGHMNTTGRVLDAADFSTWIAGQQKLYAGVTKYLPKYSLVYTPQPLRNAG